MIFGLDCDGVAADLVGTVIQTLRDDGLEMPDHTAVDDAHYDFMAKETTPFSEEARLATLELMNTRGFAQHIAVIEGAIEGVEKLKKAGHEVYWITAPWTKSETWDFDRRAFILKHFGDNYKKIIIGHPKFLVNVDVFVDDAQKNVDAWQKANPDGLALIYNQPWNQLSKSPRFSWKQVDVLLKELEKR